MKVKRSHEWDWAWAHEISLLSRGERFQGVQGRAMRWGWEGRLARAEAWGVCEHTSTLAQELRGLSSQLSARGGRGLLAS